jgi:hypothetical protein
MDIALLQGEPAIESNRVAHEKLCAECGERPAAVFCSRCRVTPYCSAACAKSHWRRAHKHVCAPHEPWASRPPAPLPPLRPFTAAELEARHLWVRLRTGRPDPAPLDERDGACALLEPLADGEFGVREPTRAHDDAVATSQAPGGAAPAEESVCSDDVCRRLGWRHASRGCAMGYGREDVVFYSLCYDSGFAERTDTNYLASCFVHARNHAGEMVVSKYRRALDPETGQRVVEQLRMSKAELADVCVWRRHLGSSRAHPDGVGSSSRMHRENMRRAELAGILRSTKFETHFL